MLLQIAIINIHILLGAIGLVLIAVAVIHAYHAYLKRLRAEISRTLLAKYNETSSTDFADWLRKSAFHKKEITIDLVFEFLENGIYVDMCAIAVEALDLVDVCITEASRGPWWEKAQAATRLGLLGSARAEDVLLDNLESKNPDVFYNSAASLLKIGHESNLNIVAESVLSRRVISVARSIDLLNQFQRPPLHLFLRKYHTAGAREKEIMLGILPSHSDDPQAEALLRKALFSRDLEIRLRAIKGAASFQTSNEISKLLIEMLNDPSWEVRSQAAKSLAPFNLETARQALFSSLGDDNRWVQFNCASSLAQQGTNGIHLLTRALMLPDETIRDMAYYFINDNYDIYRRVQENNSEYELEQSQPIDRMLQENIFQEAQR